MAYNARGETRVNYYSSPNIRYKVNIRNILHFNMIISTSLYP